MAPRTDRLLKLECPAQSIAAAPARNAEPLRATPRVAVRMPAFTLDAFLEAIDPGSPQAPRLDAVRVIAPKRPSQRPAAAQVRWWYGQAKAVAAALLVATALWLGIGRAGNTVLGSNRLGKAIAERAEVQFSDDFRGDLRSWRGSLNGWSYQSDGYMRPGEFAIFAPSQKHPDYRLEFMTLVERKSVDWSVRARDSRNYYAMKLAVVKPGPRPEMKLVRYPVVNGRKGAVVEVPVTAQLNQETPYVVSVQVDGGSFTASVEGQQIDTWSDNVLASGGVAVFSETGERARVYWLKVTSNDDLIGKLCAFLAGKRDGEVAARGPRSSWPGPWFALSLTPGASLAASRTAAGSGNGG
jgi:hypothetical protein